MENTNKTALITGGSKGIGKAMAVSLAKEGYRVALTSRNKEEVEATAREITALTGNEVLGLASDVTQYDDHVRTIEKINATWGRLDVLVANAGVGVFAPVDEMEIEDWHRMVDTNLTGVFYSIKSAAPLLKQSKGYIVTIASLAGTNFFENGSGYNATKFGLVGFTQAAMLDLRKHGVKVTTFMPGSVSTYFNHNTPSEKDDWKIQPEDLGQLLVDVLRLDPRTLPSKIEIRPSFPPVKR